MECPAIDWRVRSLITRIRSALRLVRIPTTHNRELRRLKDLRQLERDVRQHVVVPRPLGVRRVEVEARAGAKIPVRVLALDARAAGGGVREEDGDAVRGGGGEEAAFLGAVGRLG